MLNIALGVACIVISVTQTQRTWVDNCGFIAGVINIVIGISYV